MATSFVLTAKIRVVWDNADVKSAYQDIKSAFSQGIDIKVNTSTAVKELVKDSKVAQRSVKALKEEVRETSSVFEAMGKQTAISLKRYGAFVIATGGIYKFAAAIGDAKDQLIEFNKQMLKVSQVTGRSYNDLSDLNGTIGKLAVSLGVSSKTLSEAAVTLAQAGLSAEDTQEALKVLAKTQLSPTFDNSINSLESMIAAMNQFGYSASDMQHVMSQLNAVAAKYPVEADDLATAIRKTGSSAAATGDKLEDLLGVFSAIRGTTRESADSIATGLRTIYARIQRPATVKFLEGFNIQLEELGKHVSSYESLKRISEVYNKIPQGDARRSLIIEEVGGIRQASRVIPILENFTKAEEIRQTALKAGATLDKEVAIAQEGLGNRITKVTEQFLDFTRKLSETTSIKATIDTFIRGTEVVIKFADALKDLIPVLGIVLASKIPNIARTFAIGTGATKDGLIPNLLRTKRASGGAIVNGPDGIDKVPAMLTRGEYVVNKRSAQAFGYGNLEKINKYAKGGFVRGKSNRYPGLPNIEDVGDLSDIEKYILERISLNSAEVNQILKMKRYTKGKGGDFRNLRQKGMPQLTRRLKSLKTSSNVELFRGIDANSIYDIFNQIGVGIGSNKAVGKEFGFNRFTPTTPFPDLAEQFYRIAKQVPNSSGSNQAAILKIFANKGTSGLANISQFSKVFPEHHRLDELETILAPGTRARILEPFNPKTNILPIELLNKKRYAKGGFVSEGQPGVDKVPAMLTKGEYVVNKRAAQAFGYGNLEKINKYAGGGKVAKKPANFIDKDLYTNFSFTHDEQKAFKDKIGSLMNKQSKVYGYAFPPTKIHEQISKIWTKGETLTHNKLYKGLQEADDELIGSDSSFLKGIEHNIKNYQKQRIQTRFLGKGSGKPKPEYQSLREGNQYGGFSTEKPIYKEKLRSNTFANKDYPVSYNVLKSRGKVSLPDDIQRSIVSSTAYENSILSGDTDYHELTQKKKLKEIRHDIKSALKFHNKRKRFPYTPLPSRAYMSRSAMLSGAESIKQDINYYKGEKSEFFEKNSAAKKRIVDINRSLSKTSLPFNLRTYSGLDVHSAKIVQDAVESSMGSRKLSEIKNLGAGVVFTLPRFLSTSLNKGIASGFTRGAKNQKIILEIKSFRGQQAGLGSGGEEEVVLPNRSSFRINKISEDKDLGAKIVHVERLAKGGFVSEGQPGVDKVPAMLTKGEFVFNKPSVDRIGAGNLRRLMKGYAKGDLVGGAKKKPRMSYAEYMSMMNATEAHHDPLGMAPNPAFSYLPRRKESQQYSLPTTSIKDKPDEMSLFVKTMLASVIGEYASTFTSMGADMQKLIQSASGAAIQFSILNSVLKTTGKSAVATAAVEKGKFKAERSLAKLKSFQENRSIGINGQNFTLGDINKRIPELDVLSSYSDAKEYRSLAAGKRTLETREGRQSKILEGRRAALIKSNKALVAQERAVKWSTAGTAVGVMGGNALSEYGMAGIRSSGRGYGMAAGGGALSGAGVGASIGVNFGGPWGAVGGAAIGAMVGLATSANEASKALAAFKFDESFKQGLMAISNVNAGRAKPQDVLPTVQEHLKRTLLGGLASTTGEERMNLQAKIDNMIPDLEKFLNNLAKGSKSFEEFNKEQDGLISIVARFSGQSMPKLIESFKSLITETNKIKIVNKEFAQEQARSLTRILEIQTISRGLINVETSLEDLQFQIERVDSGLSGRVGEFRPRNTDAMFDAAQKGLNPRGLREVVEGLGMRLGPGGKEFAGEAIKISEAIAQLPEILHRVSLQQPEDDEKASQIFTEEIKKFAPFIQKAFQTSFDKNVTGKTGKETNITEALASPEGFIETVHKLGKSLEPFMDTLKELGSVSNKHVAAIESIYSKQRQIESEMIDLRIKALDKMQGQEDIVSQLQNRPQNIALLQGLERQRRESFFTGGSARTPDDIAAEIKSRNATIAGLDKQFQTAEVQAARAKEASQVDKLTKLLGYMADSTNAVTIAQKALEPVIAKSQAKFELAKQFIVGDAKSRRNLGRTLLGAQFVAKGGQFERLPPSMRQDVMSALEGVFKDAKILRNAKGEAVSGTDVIRDYMKKQFGIEQGPTEKNPEFNALIAAFEESKNATIATEKLRAESIPQLEKMLGTQNENFLNELKQIFRDVELGRLRGQEAGVAGREGKLDKKTKAVEDLRSLGIAPEKIGLIEKSLPALTDMLEAEKIARRVEQDASGFMVNAKEAVDKKSLAKYRQDINDPNSGKYRQLLNFAGGDATKAENLRKDLIAATYPMSGTSPQAIISKFRESELERAKKLREEANKKTSGLDDETKGVALKNLPALKEAYLAKGESSVEDLQKERAEIATLKAELEALKKAFGLKKASGGAILHGQNGIDRVPALLTKGEYVIKKSSAQAFGYGNLDKINRYADGGSVGGPTSAMAGDDVLKQIARATNESVRINRQILDELKKQPGGMVKRQTVAEQSQIAGARNGVKAGQGPIQMSEIERKRAKGAVIAKNAEFAKAKRDFEAKQKAEDERIKLGEEGLGTVGVSKARFAEFAKEDQRAMMDRISQGVIETKQGIDRDAKIAKKLELGIAERAFEASKKIENKNIMFENKVPVPTGKFGVTTTQTDSAQMGGVIKALQDMVQKLTGAPTSGVKDKVADIFNGKDGLINKLSDAIGGMPSEIDGSFTHNVNVTHNGVEVMTTITPMVEEMVKKETVKAITQFLKRNNLQTDLIG